MAKTLEDMFVDIDMEKLGGGADSTPANPEPTPPTSVDANIPLDNPTGDNAADNASDPTAGATPGEDDVDAILAKETETPAEAPAEAEVPATKESADDAAGQDGQDDVQKILEDIMATSESADEAEKETDEAAKELKTKVEESGNDELKAKLADYEGKIETERIERSRVEKSYESLQSEYDKLLKDKLVSDASGQKATKIQEVINSDPELQAIVAYAYKSESDDSYKERLVDSAKEYLRKVGGIDVDELLKGKGQAAKNQLGDDASTLSNPDLNGDKTLYGMFE